MGISMQMEGNHLHQYCNISTPYTLCPAIFNSATLDHHSINYNDSVTNHIAYRPALHFQVHHH
jgi:hypothetical protein